MTQRALLAISALLALGGASLFLGGPAADLEAAGQVAKAAGGMAEGGALPFRSGSVETYRWVGALMMGSGILGIARHGRSPV